MADETPIVGRYELGERLGSGAMSQVWAATDLVLNRRVALKFLARNADPERFRREARAAAALSHPNIVGLYDYGTADDGRPFMALECLAGGTLEERLTPGLPMQDDEAARVASDVAAGLAHAHARGVLHRDLKPGNILFDSGGRAKIGDLGIARLSGAGTLTEAGTVLGTAAYIAPEQARGEPASPASDVYSFGVVLYRLLTGRLPFEADEPLALVAMHATADPPPVAELRPDAPPLLESVAAAAMAKDPRDRPADGAALAAALRDERGLASTVVVPSARTEVIPARAEQPRPRRGRIATLAALVLLLAAGGAAAAMLLSGEDEGAPTLPEPTLSIPESRDITTAPPAPSPSPAPATSEETTTGETTTEATTSEPQPTTAPPPTATEPATTQTETVPTETVPTEPPTTETLPVEPPPTTSATVAQ